MREACCFNYLNEFRCHALTRHRRSPDPLPPSPLRMDLSAPAAPAAMPPMPRTGEEGQAQGSAGEVLIPADEVLESSRRDAADALIGAASATR